MTYYMGWCFLVGFFFPCFLGTGRGKRLYCSWLGWGAAGVHQMPVGIEVVPGPGRGGDTDTAFVCVSEGTAAPGVRGRGHREGGCHGEAAGNRTPIPFPAGWEVGQEVRRAALISAVPPMLNPGGWWDVAMGGGGVLPSITAIPKGCILLCPTGISTQHGRSHTSVSVE